MFYRGLLLISAPSPQNLYICTFSNSGSVKTLKHFATVIKKLEEHNFSCVKSEFFPKKTLSIFTAVEKSS